MGHGSLSSDPWPIWPIQFWWPIRPIDPWPIVPLSALTGTHQWGVALAHFNNLDLSNAFNTLRRDSMLEAVKQHVPEIFNFYCLAYADGSDLLYEDRIIRSEEGPQQGDPLGPFLFCLTLQPVLNTLQSLEKCRDLSEKAPTISWHPLRKVDYILAHV